ncbi:MAG TPA: hypothetical protein VIC57_13565 [Candidatus Dormibacteraeota bacterium]
MQPALLLVNRNYTRLWAGQAVSVLGDFVFATTLAPREYLGRVMSVLVPLTQLAQIVAIAAAGWLASTVLLGFHASLGRVACGAWWTRPGSRDRARASPATR